MSKTVLRTLTTALAGAVLVVGMSGTAHAGPKDTCTFGWPGFGEKCDDLQRDPGR